MTDATGIEAKSWILDHRKRYLHTRGRIIGVSKRMYKLLFEHATIQRQQFGDVPVDICSFPDGLSFRGNQIVIMNPFRRLLNRIFSPA